MGHQNKHVKNPTERTGRGITASVSSIRKDTGQTRRGDKAGGAGRRVGSTASPQAIALEFHLGGSTATGLGLFPV